MNRLKKKLIIASTAFGISVAITIAGVLVIKYCNVNLGGVMLGIGMLSSLVTLYFVWGFGVGFSQEPHVRNPNIGMSNELSANNPHRLENSDVSNDNPIEPTTSV